MPLVEVPRHGLVEFPDEMSAEQISSAIQENFPDLKQAPVQSKLPIPEFPLPIQRPFNPLAGNFAGPDPEAQAQLARQLMVGAANPVGLAIQAAEQVLPESVREFINRPL